MAKRYEYLKDLTSDVAIRAYGKDLKTLLSNAGAGLIEIMCKTRKIRPTRCVDFTTSAGNEKELLYRFLQEIIAHVDTESMFFRKVEILSCTDLEVKARLWGDAASQELGNTVVKAVTNYMLSIEKPSSESKRWVATYTVDIQGFSKIVEANVVDLKEQLQYLN